MATDRVKKRFVAGAQCPQCKTLDSIVMFIKQEVKTVECVNCDYRDQQDSAPMPAKKGDEIIGLFKL